MRSSYPKWRSPGRAFCLDQIPTLRTIVEQANLHDVAKVGGGFTEDDELPTLS